MARLKKGERARNVACLIWAEDMEERYGEDWYFQLVTFLDGLHWEIAVSPLHDKDKYDAEDVRKWVDRHIDPDHYSFISTDLDEVRAKAPVVGQPKKPHVHVLFRLDAPRTRDWFTESLAPFFDIPCTKWEKIDKWDSMLRYLAHLDSPDKYTYSSFDIVGLGGVDMSALLETNKTSRVKLLCEINREITQHRWKYYIELDRWAYTTGDMEIISLVTGRAPYFAAKFNSARQQREDVKNAKKAKEKLAKEQATTSKDGQNDEIDF